MIVFAHYYSPQKAFDFSFLRSALSNLDQIDSRKLLANWAGFLKNLLCSLLILFTLWRVGRKVRRWLGLDLANTHLRFSMEMALAILFFNSLWLGLGLNGLWFDPLLLTLALFFLGFSLWDFSRNYMRFQKFPRFEWPGWFYAAIGCLGAMFLGLSLAQGAVPEVYFDALVYHLSALSFWKFHHGVADFYTNLYSYYPFGAELYFFNGFFLQGGEAAKMLNAFIPALCALAAAGWVMEESGMAPGILAWTMVMALPLVSSTVWAAQNDVFLAYFLILFFYALARWIKEKGSWRWAVAAGFLGGGALATKYTAAVAVLTGLLAAALTHRGTLRIKFWPRWGIMKGLIFLGLAPWLLKNFIYSGNPFYPYFSTFMGGHALSAEKMGALMGDHESPFLGGFSLTTWIGRTWENLDKTTAPLLLSFLPFLFLRGKRRPVTKTLGVLSGLLLVGGFLVSYQLRLMIPAFVVCFTFMVFTLSDLKKPLWVRFWAWVVAVFGLLSFLSLCRLSVDYYHSDKVWSGKQTGQEYLSAPQTPFYYSLTVMTGLLLPPSDQLLIVGDSRGLYYPRSFYTNSVFDDQVLALLAQGEKDGEGICKRLRQMGVDDLVISGREGQRLARQYRYYPLAAGEWKRLDDFIQRRTDLVYLEGMNGIYRLRAEPARRKSPIPDLLWLLRSPQ